MGHRQEMILLTTLLFLSLKATASVSMRMQINDGKGRASGLYQAPAVYNASAGIYKNNYIITSRPVNFISDPFADGTSSSSSPSDGIYSSTTLRSQFDSFHPPGGLADWGSSPYHTTDAYSIFGSKPVDSNSLFNKPVNVDSLSQEVHVPINLQDLVWSLNPDENFAVNNHPQHQSSIESNGIFQPFSSSSLPSNVNPTMITDNLHANVEKQGVATVVKIMTKKPWHNALGPLRPGWSTSSITPFDNIGSASSFGSGTVSIPSSWVVHNPNAVTTTFWGSAGPSNSLTSTVRPITFPSTSSGILFPPGSSHFQTTTSRPPSSL